MIRNRKVDDKKIVELYFSRDERAVEETQSKYGSFCYRIAYHILNSVEDSEETVNDTYIEAWESIPPHRPAVLSAFLGKITRRLSMNRLRYTKAKKRYPEATALALDELSECVPARNSVSEELEAKELGELIDKFIQTLRATDRRIFVCRYFYLDNADDIAKEFKFSKSKVYRSLEKTRKQLRLFLTKEGFFHEE